MQAMKLHGIVKTVLTLLCGACVLQAWSSSFPKLEEK
jgi:hypothetical protein